jgi:hypothetical protein
MHSQAARPGTEPVPTAAPMPASPALDPQGRQQDSNLPVSHVVIVLLGCHADLQRSCVQPFLLLYYVG